MKKKSPKGVLTDTIPWPKGHDPKGSVQILSMMIALLDHYNIPVRFDNPDAAWMLAYMLTRDYVVRPAPARRPRKRPPHRPYDLAVGFRDLHIFMELERVRRQGGQVVFAANELSKRWCKKDICHWSGESLRQRYYKIRGTIRRTGAPPRGMGIAAMKESKSSSTSKI